jgi:site-specific recombinase XerD
MAIFHSRGSVQYAAAAGAPSASTLRVKDVAFSANQIVVRDHKGHKDRVSLLPATVKESPGRKYPNAGREWAWQTVFPATRTYVDRLTGQRRRYLHDIRTVQERLGRSEVSTTSARKSVSGNRYVAEASPWTTCAF